MRVFKNIKQLFKLNANIKDLDTPTSQEFNKLLNSQLSKSNIEEGKI